MNNGELLGPDGERLRPATAQELARSLRAALRDGGEGLIDVDGIRCRVSSPFSNEDVRALQREAQARRDLELVDLCRAALAGDEQARLHCEIALLDERIDQD